MIKVAAVLREIIFVCISFWFFSSHMYLFHNFFPRDFVKHEIFMQLNGSLFWQWRPHLKTISSLSKF